MFCPNCGKQIPDVAAFCTGCGSPIRRVKAPNASAEEKQAAPPVSSAAEIKKAQPRAEMPKAGQTVQEDRLPPKPLQDDPKQRSGWKRGYTYAICLLVIALAAGAFLFLRREKEPKTDRYLTLAQSYADAGNLEEAMTVLQDGYIETGNEDLLRRYNELLNQQKKASDIEITEDPPKPETEEKPKPVTPEPEPESAPEAEPEPEPEPEPPVVVKPSTLESGIMYNSCHTNADGFIVNGAGLVISDCTDYALTEADVADLSIEDLKISRNEFYARKGMQYGDESLNVYFGQYPWYQQLNKIPLETWRNNNFDATLLTATERKNIDFLMKTLTSRIELSPIYRKILRGGYWHEYRGNICRRYLFDADGTVAILTKDVRDGSFPEQGHYPGFVLFEDADSFVIAGIERVWHVDRNAADKSLRVYWDEPGAGGSRRHYLIYHDDDQQLNVLQAEAALYG